jgi:membrane protein DedA with SNARE-associated domain
MHWRRFLVFNAIGAALWVGVWVTIGYVSGSHIDSIYAAAIRYDTYLAAVFVALVLAYVVRRVIRRRRAHAAERAPDSSP